MQHKCRSGHFQYVKIFYFLYDYSSEGIDLNRQEENVLDPRLKKGMKGGPKKHKEKEIYSYILFQTLNPTGVPHLCPLPN